MNWESYLFEKTEDADTLQMAFRGVIVFITAVIILRAGGKRTFGKGTAIDNIVVIMLGGMLGRVVTGTAAYFPVTAAVIIIMLVYRLLAWLSLFEKSSSIIMGQKTVLFKNGSEIKKAMKKTLTSTEDLREAARLRLNTEDLSKVDTICMERNGEISVTEKNKEDAPQMIADH